MQKLILPLLCAILVLAGCIIYLTESVGYLTKSVTALEKKNHQLESLMELQLSHDSVQAVNTRMFAEFHDRQMDFNDLIVKRVMQLSTIFKH